MHPYAGIGSVLSFIGAVTLIAGIASAIVYDLKISKYSRKIEEGKGRPFPPAPEEYGKRDRK
jgi:hypothetical protein